MFKKPSAPANALADRIKKVTQTRPAEAAPASLGFAAKRPPRAERTPMFRNAALVMESGRVVVAITNLSASGARVEFTHQPELPDRVTLVAVGLRREAKVVWIKQNAAGLRFID